MVCWRLSPTQTQFIRQPFREKKFSIAYAPWPHDAGPCEIWAAEAGTTSELYFIAFALKNEVQSVRHPLETTDTVSVKITNPP